MTTFRRAPWRRHVLLAAGMCVLAAGCGDGGDSGDTVPRVTPSSVPVTAAPGAPPTTTGPAPFDEAYASDTLCSDPARSSRADFDPRGGRYPAYLYGINTTRRTLTFDVVQVLAGEDGVRAFHADHPSETGKPPNGSWLVNAYVHTDEAPVATTVDVRVSGFGESPVLVPGAFDGLDQVRGVGVGGIVWLTFRDGTITELCRELRFWSTGDDGLVDPSTDDAPPGSLPDCPGMPTSSRADFDPAGGRYMAYLFGVDTTRRTVAFDVVQMLSGEEAIRVWKQHPEVHPDEPTGPPNDYFIVNAFVHTDEAVVAGDARVLRHHPSGAVVAADFADIPTQRRAGRHPGYGLYWLTFSQGTVTEICQQFTP